jgi:hypothetical protein
MIIAAHQPQYLPWLGFFDKIDSSDAFVLMDTVQFKKNEWQNRNRIKTAQGWQWLTVPVKFSSRQAIHDIRIDGSRRWWRKHVQVILYNYRKAPYFQQYGPAMADLLSKDWDSLAELNVTLIKLLSGWLGIETPCYMASKLGDFTADPNVRLIEITLSLGGNTYLAGAGGREYMRLNLFQEAGIEVVFQDYRHPVYNQLHGDFVPNLSVIDLLFNCGPESRRILKG